MSTCYRGRVRDIEAELRAQLQEVMRRSGKTQADFAAHQGVSRQSVNAYFTGRRSLLTDTGRDLLEFLELRLYVEPLETLHPSSGEHGSD